MNVPEPLMDEIEEGKCLPFIGSGFSQNARLPEGRQMPAWAGLTKILAERTEVSPDLGGPRVASAFEKKFGRVQLIEAIRRALHVDHAEPGDAHRKFAELTFDTIYTTNFDLLLEATYDLIRRPFQLLVGEHQIPFHGGPQTISIVKMHGDLRHQEHIIVTQEDYDSYIDDYPIIATHLSAMLITKTPLFIGYSLSDPDFQNIRKIVRSRLGKFTRMSYIIQFDVPQDQCEAMLKDYLHVINIPTRSKKERDSKLGGLFLSIRKDLDIREGRRLRLERPHVFETVATQTFAKTTLAEDAPSLLTSTSNLCFVVMPYQAEFETVYELLISPVCRKFGLGLLRIHERIAQNITEAVRTLVQQARLCVADLSNPNPDILYELGIAQALGKPIVLITRQISEIPPNLASIRYIVYDPDSPEKARPGLEHLIERVFSIDRLKEAQTLIGSGMYRAAAAILGIVLQQSLRRLIIKHRLVSDEDVTGHPFSFKQALQALAKIIKPEDQLKLKRCIEIRNQAVHDLKEIGAEDVHFMLDTVEGFNRKHP
jgi:uncharacterized protein YutE (UPF0331/DUF86 family)